MSRCEAPHPDDSSRTCLIPEGRHADHQDRGGAWPNAEVQEELRVARDQKIRKKGTKRNSTLAKVAASLKAGKAEGMATSGSFRVTFMTLMAELATRQSTVTTNDVWAEWRGRGWPEPESAQASGIAGRALAILGVLERTDDIVTNNAGNGHSEDRRVVVWRSKVVGRNISEFTNQIVKEYG